MAGCALVLNSACWSSGSCFSTLSNQGCNGSKRRQPLLCDGLMPSQVGHKQRQQWQSCTTFQLSKLRPG